MASLFLNPMILHYKRSTITSSGFKICKPMCSVQSKTTSIDFHAVEPVVRRSANYDPTLWSFDHIQSLSSKYTGEDNVRRANRLKDNVKKMMYEVNDVLSTLELVDDLQRLGISYRFEDEISHVLKKIYNDYFDTHDQWDAMDLNLKALGFRLLRDHGYQVPQEIFSNFKEKTQDLKPDSPKDMVAMLNLYEASYLSFENESILDDVRVFTTEYLKRNLSSLNGEISTQVSRSLEIPLHWRVPRVEAKWYIEVYEQRSEMNPTLIELAKLDFNMVQAIHLEDLKQTSRWWRNTRWDEKLKFSRDRLVEHFMWALGFGYLPQYGLERRTLTKVNSLITTIDDVYDLYGTVDELERFTQVIDRWDINAIEELPDYMKICFMGFYNTINEMAYGILTDTGFNVLPYLQKEWAELCKSYLVEAKWYHGGYTPTLEEYLENAYISIAGYVILLHVNCLTSFASTEDMLQQMEKAKSLIRYSSLIFRLANDLGTSSEEVARGDIAKSVQCYMHESGATEDEARMYIWSLIRDIWKKLNKERASANSQLSQEFIDCAMNIPRMTIFMYHEGDGHGHPDLTKSHVLSLLFNPIDQGII